MSLYGNEEAVELNDCYSENQLNLLKKLMQEGLFTVLNIKLWKCSEPWAVPVRKISDNLMLIVNRGCLSASAGGQEKELGPGDILTIPEFIEHSYRLGKNCRSAELYILHILFDLPGTENLFAKLHSHFSSLMYKEASLAELRRITAFRTISKGKAVLAAASFVKRFFFEQIEQKRLSMEFNLPADRRMEKAFIFMQNNFSGLISVSDIASSDGLHEVQFRKLFNETFHCSPLKELNRIRLLHSLRLLSLGHDTIAGIAGKCGFSSSSYYCLAFRKFFKISPETFKDKYLR